MERQTKKRSGLTILLFIIYIALLASVILFKLPFRMSVSGIRAVNWAPFLGSVDEFGSLKISELASNFIIFIPLGIYLCMLKNQASFLQKLLRIIGLTALFEIIQYIFAIGRSDVTDILMNTAGGMAGIFFYALLAKIFKNKAEAVIRISAFIITIAAVLIFAFLFIASHRPG